MRYRTWSIRQMFMAYADENDRICRKDAETAQREIEKELRRRLEASLVMLRTADEAAARQIYTRFVEH